MHDLQYIIEVGLPPRRGWERVVTWSSGRRRDRVARALGRAEGSRPRHSSADSRPLRYACLRVPSCGSPLSGPLESAAMRDPAALSRGCMVGAARGAGRRQVATRRCGPREARGSLRRGHAAARARPPARAHGAALGNRARATKAYRELCLYLRPHGLRKLHGLPGGAGRSPLYMPRDNLTPRPRTSPILVPVSALRM
ncbi:unnamed protein product [Pieris brassicae]|uniref:Uncharacterized protein n=1 Tax=Pieris brassicae TaxID=7116 RepID=A0A9P0WYT4_PIEBR|nr:unnamed protein product [Pieris brassicae]